MFIDWTFTLNNNNRTIPAGSTLTDTIPPLLANLTSARSKGTAKHRTRLATWPALSTTARSLSIPSPAALRACRPSPSPPRCPRAILSSRPRPSSDNSGTLTILGDGGGSYTGGSGNVGVNTSLIAKSGKGYDASTQAITWELEVNRNGKAITGAKIVDTLGANQELLRRLYPRPEGRRRDHKPHRGGKSGGRNERRKPVPLR